MKPVVGAPVVFISPPRNRPAPISSKSYVHSFHNKANSSLKCHCGCLLFVLQAS